MSETRNCAIDGARKREELVFSPRANGPGACGQFNCSVGIGKQFLAQSLADRRLNMFATRGEVVRRRALAGKERLPIIVEAGEARDYVERMLRQIFQVRLFKQAVQSFLRTHGETAGLVEGSRFRIDSDGCVPKLAPEPCTP